MSDRHPLGRTCRKALPMALLMLPWALIRYGFDCLHGKPWDVA